MFKLCMGKDVETEFKRQICENGSVGMRGDGPFMESKNFGISCSYYEDEKILGYGLATIYDKNSIERCSQWNFGENRKREIWIDDLWSVKNVGKDIMKILTDEILKRVVIEDLERKNIYIMALGEASGFYHSLGYEEIVFNEDEEDEDCPYVFSESTGLKIWMAKGLDEMQLDKEVIFDLKIDEWYFGNCLERDRMDMLQKILTFPVPSYKYLQQLRDLDCLSDPDKFQADLMKYIRDGQNNNEKFEELAAYFNHPLAQEMINNYYLNGNCSLVCTSPVYIF